MRKKKRRQGERTVSYAGRVVYDRKPRNFRLIRVAKIADQIFNRWNETDSPPNSKGQTEAHTSTIWYLFQRMEVWLKNRDVYFEIFRNHFSPDLDRLDIAKANAEQTGEWEGYAAIAEEIFRRFDQFFGVVQQVARVIGQMAPELFPITDFLDNLVSFYAWVRENYPTGAPLAKGIII